MALVSSVHPLAGRRGSVAPPAEHSMRALIIDDSRAIRLILTRLLTELGFETDHAEDGQDGLEAVERRGPFDLALVDWNMPEMNGYEFVKAVRQRPNCGDMKLIMVTTETEMQRVVKALEAGADEYVMKPFTRDVLAEKLAILGIRQSAG